MRLEGAYTIPAERDVVWQSLLDLEVLARALPGDGKLEPNSDGSFHAELKVGIAAVKGTYHGHIQILDAVAPEHYRMRVEGQGTGGFVRGEGTLTLSQNGAGSTVVAYAGDAQVGGVIANVGQRLMQGAAKQIVGKFFLEFSKQLQKPAVAAVPSPQPASQPVSSGLASATSASPLLGETGAPSTRSTSTRAAGPEPVVISPPAEPAGGLHEGDRPSHPNPAAEASEPGKPDSPAQRGEPGESGHHPDDRAPEDSLGGPPDGPPGGSDQSHVQRG